MTTLPDLLYVALFAVVLPLWTTSSFGRHFVAGHKPIRLGRGRGSGRGPSVRVGAGRRRGGAVGGERPILDVVRIFRARRLAVVDIHRLVPAARGLLRLCGRDPRPQLRGTGERAAAVRNTHRRLAAHADRNVLVRWGVADRGVLRGVSVSRLLHLGPRPVARLVGRRGAVPSDLRDAGMLTRDGMASSARESSARSSRWSWRSSAPSGRRSRCTPSSISASGMIAWLALREGQATGDVTEVEKPTEPQSASGVESSPVQAEPGAAPDPARDIGSGSS